MRRNPGEWLRDRVLDRLAEVGLLTMGGIGCLVGAGFALWVARGPGQALPEWIVWSVPLLPGAFFLGVALFKAKRGWRLADMQKGADAEERVGQVIEYALTREGCAVAHHVEEIAKKGDIDHLVATPRGLWVIETKSGRLPKPDFAKELKRIALNVDSVREWAPGMQVTGCLVFATEPEKTPKRTFKSGAETIRCFANPESLMRQLRDEACAEGDSSGIAKKVWRLAKVGTASPATEHAEQH